MMSQKPDRPGYTYLWNTLLGRDMTEEELEYWRDFVKRAGREPTAQEFWYGMADREAVRERIEKAEQNVEFWQARYWNLVSRVDNHLNRIIELEWNVGVAPRTGIMRVGPIVHTCALCITGRCDKSYDHT